MVTSLKQKTRIKIPVVYPSFLNIVDLPLTTMVEWEETSKMAAFISRVVTALSSTLN